MNQINDKILAVTKEITDDLGFLLIDVLERGDSRNRIVEVFIDSETAVSTDDCAKVSRLLDERIEEANLIQSKYRLEVSSPGVSRPLIFLPQYTKHIGRQFDLKYSENEETKRFKGKLTKIDGSKLWFSSGNNEVVVDFEIIVKAKVLISF